MQKEKLSALMDGEMLDNELLSSLSKDRALQQSWQSYHLIRDTLRGDIGQVMHFDIADRVAAALEKEPARLVPSAIPESQPQPHTWGKLPFWHKVRPWASQLTQVGVAACVSLAVIVGVQQYNQPTAQSGAAEAPAFNTLPIMGQASRSAWASRQTVSQPAAVNSSRCRNSVSVSMPCCRIMSCNVVCTPISCNLNKAGHSRPQFRFLEHSL